ncbi:MAG: family 20 glycosylhydrolase, partial [Ginsengibacter sp.]
KIEDWPSLEMRMIYWDDAHHLERLKALKAEIRRAAFFKINALSIKLEGHFQFASARPLIEPYAYTPEEYQQITNYAKDHFVELIPYLDAPAHISFILKHPEYYSLRSFPSSNYELSVTNPQADKLILAMFDDLIDANKGSKHIVFSTDEAYYVGKGESEKSQAKALGGNGKLLADYIKRISAHLHDKGKDPILWIEYPLTSDDISMLPSYIIDGEYNPKWASQLKKQGIKQLIYTSTQGVEPLFPNYYKLVADPLHQANSTILNDDELQQGDLSNGRVNGLIKTIKTAISNKDADFLGTIVAGWGDAGLNPETFWLGYATGCAFAWNVNSGDASDLSERFYQSFYGNRSSNIQEIYKLLSVQAQFWDKSWQWKESSFRKGIFGNSSTVFDVPKAAKDQFFEPLPLPEGENLKVSDSWKTRNSRIIQMARAYLKENDTLMSLLQDNFEKANYNQHNLQILRTVAVLCRQNLKMILQLDRIDQLLKLSSKASITNPAICVSLMDLALDLSKDIKRNRNMALYEVCSVWYQDWFPRVEEANGRTFLNKVDDVKDHQPVRSVDMSYLIYRELNFPFSDWANKLIEVRNSFAQKHGLPARNFVLNWERYK